MKLRKAIKPIIKFEKKELQNILQPVTLWRMKEIKEKIVGCRKWGKLKTEVKFIPLEKENSFFFFLMSLNLEIYWTGHRVKKV